MAHPSQDGDAGGTDKAVLELRSSGRSFAFIARTLNMGKARDANAAFLRAVRGAKPAEAKRLRTEELARLQQLEDKLRGDRELAPFDLDKQLDVLKALRAQLAT